MRSCWYGYSRQRLGLQCLWQCRDCLHRRASLHLGVDLSTQFLPLVPDPFEGALLPKLRCINSLLGPYWITGSADAVQLWYHLRINTTSKIYKYCHHAEAQNFTLQNWKTDPKAYWKSQGQTTHSLCKQGLINCELSFWLQFLINTIMADFPCKWKSWAQSWWSPANNSKYIKTKFFLSQL